MEPWLRLKKLYACVRVSPGPFRVPNQCSLVPSATSVTYSDDKDDNEVKPVDRRPRDRLKIVRPVIVSNGLPTIHTTSVGSHNSS